MNKAIHISKRGNFLIGRTVHNIMKLSSFERMHPEEIAGQIDTASGGVYTPTVKDVRSALYRMRFNRLVEKDGDSPYWRLTGIGKYERYGFCHYVEKDEVATWTQ